MNLLIRDNKSVRSVPLLLFYFYAMDNLEVEIDKDNHSPDNHDEDDYTSQSLIKVFGPHND